ncbi:hypothetical protein FRB99_008867 [Tulasnella sp. 403]|nr:hypothetical protein FRB99_008867 [Tulasnella sp. 403]
MSPPPREIRHRRLPKILPTDSYPQCYKKVEEFLDYLLQETEGKGIPEKDLTRLRRAKKDLEDAKARPAPLYFKQLVERSGHRKAEIILLQLKQVQENYVQRQTKANTLVRDARMAARLVQELVSQETYVFDDPDDMHVDLDYGLINPANIIFVDTSNAIATGGFGKIFRGEGDMGVVAVKQPSQFNREKAVEQFRREARVWRGLTHENILPLRGVCLIDTVYHIVSPYMKNGNLRQFVVKNPDVDRVRFVSLDAK